MKKSCVRTLLTLVLAAAPLALRAETGLKVTFNAPFSFIAGTKTLPAGAYQILEDDSHVLTIQPLNGSASANVLFYGVGNSSALAGGLNFVRRAGMYYLNTVKLGDGRTVRVLGQPVK